MGTLVNLFHMTMFLAYGFTAYEAFFDLHIPVLAERFKKFDPGQFKYLTIWGVVESPQLPNAASRKILSPTVL